MSDDLVIDERLSIPSWELWYTTSRASGAGGQHVNTTDSRVTIHWVPANSSVLDDAAKARVLRRLRPRLTSDGELQLSAQDERSQHRNREIVRERLAALIRESLVVQRRRRATRPTRGSIERRLTEKRVTAEKKRARKPPSDD